jgi:hypothetical protein
MKKVLEKYKGRIEIILKHLFSIIEGLVRFIVNSILTGFFPVLDLLIHLPKAKKRRGKLATKQQKDLSHKNDRSSD